ncbi:MAG: serine/threonine protein kinase [Elusimicrobia bacterium]|nr:serine/threonine protein kinase [Elusimicrobiota bacterium]
MSGLVILLLAAEPALARPRAAAPQVQLSVSTETESAAGTPAELAPQLHAVMAETEPMFSELAELEKRYQQPRSIGSLREERAALRKKIERQIEHFVNLFEQFEDRRRLNETMKIQGVLMQFMGGKIPSDPMGMYERLKRNTDLAHLYHQWQTKAQGRLDTEALAFQSAERLAWIHLGLAIAAVSLAIGLVGAVLYGRFHAKKSARLETDISRLAAASGSVYQGIGTAPATAPAAAGPIATVLGGNYAVERELGRGGMGVVFEALDLSLRRKVAVKKLREELHERVQELETLLAEARLVADLRHPNIVEIYSIFKEQGRIFLVFELVSGRSLAEVLDQHGLLTLRQAKGVLRQIGSALDYAHSKKVIHRDLKPANIMVTGEGAVKVMDFGIAHRAKVTVAKLTQQEAWGTPPYMAPEQELGHVSRESDLFALGAMFYEMLIGKLPFEGPNFLAQKQSMDYVKPCKARGDLPPAIDAIIGKALAPDPALRFHSAAEFYAALETVPDGK